MGTRHTQPDTVTDNRPSGQATGVHMRARQVAPDTLLPLLAGARARGIADAFDLMGLACILLDRAGMALHANAAARAMMGRDIALTHRHLVSRDPDQTRSMQSLIAEAVEGKTTGKKLHISAVDRPGGFEFEALPVTETNGEASQLLKAVLLIR